MPKFLIRTGVTGAEGYQMWAVEAHSEAAALLHFEEHGGEFVDEEVEVMDLGEPEIVGLHEPVPVTQATELEYLRHFFQNADFGPAHDDVVAYINEQFTGSTGLTLPLGYERE